MEGIRNQIGKLVNTINRNKHKDGYNVWKNRKGNKRVKKKIIKQKKEKPNNIILININNNINTSIILVEILPPTFEYTKEGEHPKKFLKEIQTYFEHRRLMVKDVIIDFDSFKNLFLKHFFSEQYQWEVFLKCTEAGKSTVRSSFQKHFHY